MRGFSFSIDFFSVLILLVFYAFFMLLRHWKMRYALPHIKFSDLKTFKILPPTFKEAYSKLSGQFLFSSLIIFSLAFLDPCLYFPKRKEAFKEHPQKPSRVPTEGLAMYFILDRSGSMGDKIMAYTLSGKRESMTKVTLLKLLTREFIEGNPQLGLTGRPNDLIGIVEFARGAVVKVPLTLDHQAVLDVLNKFTNVTEESKDGTAIGYAIYKTANLIAATRHFAEELAGEGKPAYEIKSNVMILVTDGFQSPSPLDKTNSLRNMGLVEAAEYARANRIRLYIVNVEPMMASEQFAANRKLLEQTAQLTGGKFFLVDNNANLGKIYADIDRLEKSPLPIEGEYASLPKSEQPDLYARFPLYPYLIALGLACIAASVLLESVLMKEVP